MDGIQELYELYHRDIYRYLLGQTRDADLAEELLSETFCAAITALPGFRGKADVKTWLFTIARHKWLDHLRTKKPDTLSLTELYIADTAPGPELTVLRREAAQRALELLERENKRTQTIVKLRIEGHSFYEIGKALNIREGSARVIDFRARNRIRMILEQEGYHDIL